MLHKWVKENIKSVARKNVTDSIQIIAKFVLYSKSFEVFHMPEAYNTLLNQVKHYMWPVGLVERTERNST